MNAQPVATNQSHRACQTFYGWNLAPSTAAMWQLAMQHAGKSLDVHTNWIDLGRDWSWFERRDEQCSSEFDRAYTASPPAAIILGIDRANLAHVAGRVFGLRGYCKRWPLVREQAFETSERDTFLLGWFPEADREAIRILRELGCDLVLHDPASLRPALAKVARFGYSSRKK